MYVTPLHADAQLALNTSAFTVQASKPSKRRTSKYYVWNGAAGMKRQHYLGVKKVMKYEFAELRVQKLAEQADIPRVI